ncbi:MAG: M20/M25/M40 family metallo-hydrolase [Saprospiraceae bacterium]|nr:M20/M25/M40 family metallo-hydrolase [Saprospiraceae bacterium]
MHPFQTVHCWFIRVFTFVFLFGCTNILYSQYDPLLGIRVDVVYLASDVLEGRETGTPGEMMAAEYIAHRMKEIGLSPKGSEDWFYEFSFKANPHGGPKIDGKGRNVVGFLNKKAKKTIVIGAHYDHLGYGGSGSRSPNEKAIHNGADDNASGIAAMLWLAENLKNEKKLKFNILFIAFSGEEMGLLGSKAFIEKPTIPHESIHAMINMDMVGRLNAEKTMAISGVGTAIEWKTHLDNCRMPGFQFNYSDGGIGPSDHTAFYLKNIPAIHFFTGQHQDYHKPSDDSHLVNYEGIREVSEIIWGLLIHLSDKPVLTFQKTKDEDKQRASSFKVTMGVMPDYVYNGEGMRVDAVLDNRPAQKAGLMGGDIIIKIGSFDIKDVYQYMEALSKFEKGQSADVTVKRKEEVLVKQVVF